MDLLFYHDHHSRPRLLTERRLRLLSAWIEGDLGSHPEHTGRILAATEAIRTGNADGWQETGNAFTLTLRPDCARLEREVGAAEAELTLPLEDFLGALRRWLDFLAAEGS